MVCRVSMVCHGLKHTPFSIYTPLFLPRVRVKRSIKPCKLRKPCRESRRSKASRRGELLTVGAAAISREL